MKLGRFEKITFFVPDPLPLSLQVLKCAGPRRTLSIIHVLKNWRVGVNIKVMDPCPEGTVFPSVDMPTPTTCQVCQAVQVYLVF